jgi:hypothetical protein
MPQPHSGKAPTNESNYPYIVELVVATDGLSVELSRRILSFHQSRQIEPRYGRRIPRDGQIYYRWCFSDLALSFGDGRRNVERHDPSIDYYLSQVLHRKKGNDADGRLPVFLRVHRLRHQTPARARRLLRLLLLWVRALSANAGQTRVHFSERHHQQCLSLALSG